MHVFGPVGGARSATASGSERRRASRFPLSQSVRYRSMLSERDGNAVTGEGVSVNVSSTGVLFTTSEPLKPGTRLELDLDWPAAARSRPIQLVMRGTVVWCSEGQAALRIHHHHFSS